MSVKINLAACILPLADENRLRLHCGQWQKILGYGADIPCYTGPALKRLALSLLARMLANENCRHVFSYSAKASFCAYAEIEELAVDAVYCQEIHAASIGQFLERAGLRLSHSTGSIIARSWAVCEALLKLSGEGLTWTGLKNIASTPVWRRHGEHRFCAKMARWHALPLAGHWVCIAAYEDFHVSSKLFHHTELRTR